jgi:hypothetical protein
MLTFGKPVPAFKLLNQDDRPDSVNAAAGFLRDMA